MNGRVFILDKESDVRVLLSEILDDEGLQTSSFCDEMDCLQAMKRGQPDLLMLDLFLDGSTYKSMNLLRRIGSSWPDLPVLAMSEKSTPEQKIAAIEAIRAGAYDLLEKPFNAERLLVLVRRATEATSLRREIRKLRAQTDPKGTLLGNAASIVALRKAIDRVAPTGSRVLISGPSGSGKELVARLVHQKSECKNAPFILMNCNRLHPDTADVDLFGEEDGLGMVRKRGFFELANRGTLVLDEIAALPSEVQTKLVKVLQQFQFHRVKGQKALPADARIMATTSKNLQEEIKRGNFREDLYYRLNVVPLVVPGLFERPGDISGLIETFSRQIATDTGLAYRPLSNDALAAMQAYDWPGNVRQLRNMVEWLMIMCPATKDSFITADMLPPPISDCAPSVLGGTVGQGELMSLPLRDARGEFERRYLESQILRFGGNITKTANFVGMERSALHRKLKSLNITIPGRKHRGHQLEDIEFV